MSTTESPFEDRLYPFALASKAGAIRCTVYYDTMTQRARALL
jgi:hypothetical protein